jgi:hypothetical protein
MVGFADLEEYGAAIFNAYMFDELGQKARTHAASSSFLGDHDVFQLPLAIDPVRY